MNILIVGLGSIATKHIEALRSLNYDAKIYALRSNLNAEKHKNIINLYNLNDIDFVIDFAIISNPTQFHEKFIRIFIKMGINLFIEKPPLNSLLRVEELLSELKASKIKTYVACNLRFHPCILFIKKYIDENKNKVINEVNVYCGSYLPDWRPNRNFRKSYSANPDLGGGVNLDLYHELDYTHWIFGSPLKIQRTLRSVSSLDILSIDYANYIFEYDKFTANIILNYYRKDSKRTIEILFEDETLNIDLIKNTIINEKGDILFENKRFQIIDTYKNQMNTFIKNLKINETQTNTLEDSLVVLKSCLNE
jgi:predicted dehydrogenase